MIHGLRLAPWLFSAHHKEPLVFANCETCMERTDQLTRQSYGCAYEPPAPAGLPVIVWSPPDGKHGFQVNPKLPLPDVCPGYLVSLPEVVEVARGHRHWLKSGLRDYCGDQPSEAMLIGVEVYDSEVNGCQSWQMTPVADGGGRE